MIQPAERAMRPTHVLGPLHAPDFLMFSSSIVVAVGVGCANVATPASPATLPSPSPAIESATPSGASGPPGVRVPAPLPVASTVKIDSLGLQIDILGTATVGSGPRPSSVTVTSHTSGWSLTVDEGSSADSLDVARAAAERLDAKNVEMQQTDDGHWLTFERKGSVGETYGVHLVRRFGNQVYRCEGLVARADGAVARIRVGRRASGPRGTWRTPSRAPSSARPRGSGRTRGTPGRVRTGRSP